MNIFGDRARCILYVKLSYWWIGQLNYRKTMHMRKKSGIFFSCMLFHQLIAKRRRRACVMPYGMVPVLYVLPVVPHNFAAAVDIIHRLLLCCS